MPCVSIPYDQYVPLRENSTTYLGEQYVKPIISDLGHTLIHFLQRLAFQERVEYRRLENFDQLQFSSALHLESFQFSDGTIEIEDGVPKMEKNGSLSAQRRRKPINTVSSTVFLLLWLLVRRSPYKDHRLRKRYCFLNALRTSRDLRRL